MEQKAPEFILYRKVILFGSQGVGKSSLISRLETNTFSASPSEDEQGNSHFLPSSLIYRYQTFPLRVQVQAKQHFASLRRHLRYSSRRVRARFEDEMFIPRVPVRVPMRAVHVRHN